MSFLDGLLLLFIGLKLTGYVEWSWVGVLAPLWVSLILATIRGLFVLLPWWGRKW